MLFITRVNMKYSEAGFFGIWSVWRETSIW